MTCSCTESFGQLHFDQRCTEHKRCPETMRGIPIQCILVENHRGDHK